MCSGCGEGQFYAIIRKGIEHQTANTLMPLYKSMVRPHLEYHVQFWSPHLKKGYISTEKGAEKSNGNN